VTAEMIDVASERACVARGDGSTAVICRRAMRRRVAEKPGAKVVDTSSSRRARSKTRSAINSLLFIIFITRFKTATCSRYNALPVCVSVLASRSRVPGPAKTGLGDCGCVIQAYSFYQNTSQSVWYLHRALAEEDSVREGEYRLGGLAKRYEFPLRGDWGRSPFANAILNLIFSFL